MSDDNRYVQHREWWDIPMILFVGALTYVLHTLWSFECIHPAVWGELAVSAGLRPPEEPFPGLYRLMVAGLFKIFSPGAVLDALPYLGRVVMSLSAMLVYLVFRDMLPTTLRIRIHMARIASLVGGLCAFMAALLFVCADPIWRAGVTFSPVSLFLLLTVVSLCLFFRFVQRGSIPSLYVCCALVGMISAESSLGFLMAGLIVLGVLLAVRWARDPDVPFVNPLVDALMQVVVFKRLTYIWAFFFMLTIGLNICGFIQMGGMEATGHDGVLGLLFEYLRCGWEATHGAAMGSGWLFIVVFCVVPLVFVLKLLPSAWDDDKFLPWSVGVVYAAMGAVAMSQLSGARVLWFWTWIDSHRAMMPSDTLLAFVLLFDVAVVTFTLAVFGVDAICRNYRRIAKQKFPESMLSTIPAQMAESLGRARALRKRLFWLIVITLPIVVVPWRSLPTERGIAHFISAMVDEIGRAHV